MSALVPLVAGVLIGIGVSGIFAAVAFYAYKLDDKGGQQ